MIILIVLYIGFSSSNIHFGCLHDCQPPRQSTPNNQKLNGCCWL